MQQRKELGQHWLWDKTSLEAIVDAANIAEGDSVLEIGPGKGSLTGELLRRNAHVLVLEYDHALTQDLIKKYYYTKNIEVIEGDVRSFDLRQMPDNYKIVANIPYYLTANLMRKLVDDEHKPSMASLLVQKEVADRIASEPGRLSAIAVMVQLYYYVNTSIVIPAHLFEPAPKVDSQILVLKLRDKPLIEHEQIEKFFKLVKAGFSQPRKKLISNLLHLYDKTAVERTFEKIGLDPNTRAQELSVDDWKKICELLHF